MSENWFYWWWFYRYQFILYVELINEKKKVGMKILKMRVKEMIMGQRENLSQDISIWSD